MKGIYIGALLLAVVLAVGPRLEHSGFFSTADTSSIPDRPVPADLFGLDAKVVGVFSGDYKAANIVGGLVAGLADRLAADGRLQKPSIRYCATVAEERKAMLDMALHDYPRADWPAKLGELLKPVFEPVAGDAMSTKALDDTTRASLVARLDALAYVLTKYK